MSWVDLKLKVKWLNQTKKFKNVEFHKFRVWDGVNKCWNTYWYLDKVDIERLTKPSKLDKKLYKM